METENQPKVVIQKVVKYKKKRSLVSLLISTICILLIFILIGSFLSVGIWLHTYKVFTQENVVADLYISKKIIKDGKPTFKVRYVPKDDVSGFWGVFGVNEKSTDAVVETEMIGDQVFINANFIKWDNWLTMINLKPVYKINRITPGYQNASDYQKFGVSVVDINGGPDENFIKMQENQKGFDWFVDTVFISGAGVSVLKDDATYQVIATEDALIIKKV